MSVTMKSLGIDRLSVDERLQLIDEIWDSIDEESADPKIPESHRDELDRRLDAYREDPGAGSSWEEVKARLTGDAGISG